MLLYTLVLSYFQGYSVPSMTFITERYLNTAVGVQKSRILIFLLWFAMKAIVIAVIFTGIMEIPEIYNFMSCFARINVLIWQTYALLPLNFFSGSLIMKNLSLMSGLLEIAIPLITPGLLGPSAIKHVVDVYHAIGDIPRFIVCMILYAIVASILHITYIKIRDYSSSFMTFMIKAAALFVLFQVLFL